MLPKEKSKFKSFSEAIAKALKAFDMSKEWEDLLTALDKLSIGFDSFEPLHKLLVCDSKAADGSGHVDASILNFLPQRYVVAKRIGQCLAPGLPGGLHQRTLQVLAQLFSKCSKETLARSAYPFLISVFPLFGVATSQVKLSILGLYEKFLIPLGDKLLPYYGGLVPSLLHGVETGSESVEKCLALLLCLSTGPYSTTFFEALWKTMLKESSVRMECFTFLAECVKSEDTSWNTSRAALCAVCSSMLDARILVKRSALDFLCSAAPISKDMFPAADIIRSILPLFSCKEVSLNRRIFNYLFNSTTSEKSADPEGDFVRFAKEPLKQTLKYYCERARRGNDTLFWLSLCEILLENEIISKHLFKFFLKKSFVLIHHLKTVVNTTLPNGGTETGDAEKVISQQDFDAFLKQFLSLFETSKLLDFYRYVIGRLGTKFDERKLAVFIEILDVIPVYEYFDGQDEYLGMFFSETIAALDTVLKKNLPQETCKMLTFCERYAKFFSAENVVQFIDFLENVLGETALNVTEATLANFKHTLSIFLKMLSDRGEIKEQIGLVRQSSAGTVDASKQGIEGKSNEKNEPDNCTTSSESRCAIESVSGSEIASSIQTESSQLRGSVQQGYDKQKNDSEKVDNISNTNIASISVNSGKESTRSSSDSIRADLHLSCESTNGTEAITSFEKFKSRALKAAESVFMMLQKRCADRSTDLYELEQKEAEKNFRYELLMLIVKISDYFGFPEIVDKKFLAAEYIELFGKTTVSSESLNNKSNRVFLKACEEHFYNKLTANETETRCDAITKFGKFYFYSYAKRNDDRKFLFKFIYLHNFLPFLCNDEMFEEKNLVLSIISENAEKVERIIDPVLSELFQINVICNIAGNSDINDESSDTKYLDVNNFAIKEKIDVPEKLRLLEYLSILITQEQVFYHLRERKLSTMADGIYKCYKSKNVINCPWSEDDQAVRSEQVGISKESAKTENNTTVSLRKASASQQLERFADDCSYYHFILLTAIIFSKLTFITGSEKVSECHKNVNCDQLHFKALILLKTFFSGLKREEKLALARYLLVEISSLLVTEQVHLIRSELFGLYLKILKVNASKESGFVAVPKDDLLNIVFGESKARSFSFFLSVLEFIRCFDTIYTTALKLLSALSPDCFAASLLLLNTFHETLHFMIRNMPEQTKEHLGELYSTLFSTVSLYLGKGADDASLRKFDDFLLEQTMQIYNTISNAFPNETVTILLALYEKPELHTIISCAATHLTRDQIKMVFSIAENSFSSKPSTRVSPVIAISFVEMLLMQTTQSFADHQCNLLSLVRAIQISGMGTKFVCETGNLLHCFFTRKELEGSPVNKKEIFDIVVSNCESTADSFASCFQKKVANTDAKTIFSVFIPSSQDDEKDESDDWEVISDDRANFTQLSKYFRDSLLEVIWLFFDEKERATLCIPVLKSLVVAVTPGRDLPFTTDILSFFSDLCTAKFAPCVSLVRKELTQQFLHPYFFAQSDDLLLGWRKIVAFLFSDQQTKAEFLAAVGATLQSTTVLFGKEALVSKKAMCLKQLSYVVYVSGFGAMESEFKFITERLIETLRGANDFLIGRVFLCLRMMLYRFDVSLFSEYWPSILSELIGISQRIVNDTARGTTKSPLYIYIAELLDALSLLEDSPFGYNDYIFLPLVQGEQKVFVQFAADAKTQSQCLCEAVMGYAPNHERRKANQKFCQQQLEVKQDDILKAFKR